MKPKPPKNRVYLESWFGSLRLCNNDGCRKRWNHKGKCKSELNWWEKIFR